MIKKEIFIGFFVGILANSIENTKTEPALIYLSQKQFFLGNGQNISIVIKQSISEDIFGKLVTIGAILNLVAFFIFIKKKQDYRARGVILATVLVAISTFLINLY